MPPPERLYDVFVSHASDDKSAFVDSFVSALQSRGLSVWYDTLELKWGDSLREEIDRGLARSRFGVVVLSKPYFAKPWPRAELDGLLSLEMNGRARVLPIWHEITEADVAAESPMLVSKMAHTTRDRSVDELANELAELCSDMPTAPSISRLDAAPTAEGQNDLSDRLKRWHSLARIAHERELLENIAPRSLRENNVQFSYSISTHEPQSLLLDDLLAIVSTANTALRDRMSPDLSIFYPFTEPSLKPYFSTDPGYEDGELEFLECSHVRAPHRGETTHDFWRISPIADATILRPIRSDFSTNVPKQFKTRRWFSPNDLMRDVSEFVRHAEAMCEVLFEPKSVAFRCEWRGLRGRDFVDPFRNWHSGHIAQSDTRTSRLVFPANRLPSEWATIVEHLINPVVRAFRQDLSLASGRILQESKSWFTL